MKREFPALYEVASVWIATPLLAFSTIFYAQGAITQSANEVYPVAIAAFGVTAALSGICFTMVSVCESSSTARYAGEKFLHSSLLLIQSLFILYVRDAAVESNWVLTYSFLVPYIKGVSAAILLLVTTASAWTWYHGFSELNAVLWRNWDLRVRKLNEAARASKSQSDDKLPTMTDSTTAAGEGKVDNTLDSGGSG